jgi:hypothetical protein
MEDNRHYVYLHHRNDNNVVFYVGSGAGNRCNQKQNRNKDWFSIAESVGFYVEKIAENLTKEEARKIEQELISVPNPEWELTNKRLPTKVHDLDINVLSRFFYYDETSPTCLRYAKNTYKNKGALSKAKDSIAGNIYADKTGKPLFARVSVNIDGVKHTFKAHRVVWCLINGSIDPCMVIDHIDNDPLNNKIENLRLVTYQSNGRNKSNLPTSSTGILGVSMRRFSFKAEISDSNGNRKSKSFSINKYGEKKALYLAAKARYEYLMQQEDHLKFTDSHSCLDKLKEIITNFESEVNCGLGPTNIPSRDSRTP